MRKGQKKRVWTPEQKAAIVHKHLDEHISVRTLEREYTADRSMICRWVKEYIAEGESSFIPNTQNNAKHSYNFIRHEGRTWYIDLTNDVTQAGKGMQVTGAVEITGTSIPDYMASYGEVKIITH